MNPLIAIALQIFPEIARYLGGAGKGGVADAVVSAVSSLAGTDPQRAREALAADPALAASLQVQLAEIAGKAEADRRQAELATLKEVLADQRAARQSDLDDLKARQADTQNARAAVAADGNGSTMAIGSLGVSFIVALAFVATLFFVMKDPDVGKMDTNSAGFQMVNITLGALTAAFVTVVSFWLGSSQGSRNKDAASFQQARSSQDTITEQASQSVRAVEKGIELSATIERAAPKLVPPGGATVTPIRQSEVGRFDQCVKVILEKEGPFVNDPHDPGGATNMGITLRTLRSWRNRDRGTQGGEGSIEVTVEEVRDLKEEEAKEIYFVNYWNALRCQELPAGLDLTVFDFGVNAGVGQAARVLQRCVFVEADGQVGSITLGAVGKFAPADLIKRFDQARMDFYSKLPGFPRFGPGWTNRVRSVETSALAMVQAA